MKYIDKFLKKLNVSRNTFATYILTLITIYLAIDRIVEMLLMIFTGVSVSYWNPIQYTLALACPIFAFLFSGASSFGAVKNTKITLFYTYAIGLYVIAISMFSQWLNMFSWLFLFSIPNYVVLITDFSNLIRPAFTAISLYLPLVTIFPFVKWFLFGVNDSQDMKRSLWDYIGIDLSDPKQGRGPYTCEVYLFKDKENGASISIPEERRFQSLFVCGGSGTGKTSLVFEPLTARDLEKKFFFKQVSKEMGFTALKTGIATLNCPYTADYINENFSLNMLSPAFGKDTIYKAYMKKMLLSEGPDLIYKNIGITSMSPDYETISHMIEVCNNFGLKYNIIDPSDLNSTGLNPFIYDDPSKIAITISSALKGMYDNAHSSEPEEAYREDVTLQAIENVAILLKEMYPRMNDGALPNLQDLLKMLNNFELIEKMCEIMKTYKDLSEKYSVQLSYFENNFYVNGKNTAETSKYIVSAITQLDNLLRLSGVKNVLCNRHNNLDFDKALANGDITFVCTRRGDIGAASHKAFGLFFILSMQNAILRRPGNEKNRVPHFLYIDEFADFICKSTEPLFTMYRKYRVGSTISVQNLSQLEASAQKHNFRPLILSNCANKIFTGNATPEEIEWWESEFGKRRAWIVSNTFNAEALAYEPKRGVKYDWENISPRNKLATLPFKSCAYKVKDVKGRTLSGEGMLNFIDSKYKEPQATKKYDFSKFTSTILDDDNDNKSKKRFNPKKVDFSDKRNEVDPVQTNTTDSKYLFDNEDAISFTFKKKT